ncbi:hypothetical protein ACFQV2_39570 [Actinokineospora soli]|uniref:Uncharacterized protein n=1 Tax=Actinokineospora soli TaxID=1048753 RepID=A0ABW2TYY6_9PSEU
MLLPGWLMAVLALSSLLLMAAHVLQALLVAVGGHRAVALAWITGAGALAGTILVPGDPIVISAWAQLGACALVVAVMVGTLVTTGGRAAVPERPTPGYGAWSRRPL